MRSLLPTLFLTELSRVLRLWWSYRLEAVSHILLWVIGFPLMMVMFDSVAEGYGPQQQAASLIGFLVWNLCLGLIAAAAETVTDEAREGTLETALLTPVTPLTLFSLRLGAELTRQVIETLVLGVILSLLVGVILVPTATALVIIGLTLLAVGGVGLALGGLALVTKNVSSVVNVVALLALFFTGALVPLNQLGPLFDLLKYTIPTTWGIDALRQTLLTHAPLTTLWQDGTLPGLTLQALVFLTLGITVFRWGIAQARRRGSLGGY